jgi:hypothetical protein
MEAIGLIFGLVRAVLVPRAALVAENLTHR